MEEVKQVLEVPVVLDEEVLEPAVLEKLVLEVDVAGRYRKAAVLESWCSKSLKYRGARRGGGRRCREVKLVLRVPMVLAKWCW